MQQKIFYAPNGKADNGYYLTCGVGLDLSTLESVHKSAYSLFADIKSAVIDDCLERGYNDDQVKAVVTHYQVKIALFPWQIIK